MEFPVFYPLVELLFRLHGVFFREGFPILLAEERSRRSHLQAQRELAASASVEWVVDTATREGETEDDRVGHTIVHIIEVFPVFEVIPLVAEFGSEGEIVIGPAETLTEADGDTRHLEELVGVVGVFVTVLVVVTVVAVVDTITVGVSPVAVVIRGVNTGLSRVVSRHTERIRTFSAKPRVEERDAVLLVVAGVGLNAQRESLTLALRDKAFESLRSEHVLAGEVGEFHTHCTDHTGLTPT